MQKIYQDPKWLYEHYAIKKESSSAMAQEAGCGNETIRRWLHRVNIPVRSRGEASFLAKKNFLILSPGLLEVLEGELLGDGCVSMRGNRSAQYQHSSKYREYLVWLSEKFAPLGLMQSGRIKGYKSKQSGFHDAITYHYASCSYPELVLVYNRWYPNGEKIVPKDLKLTSIMARQWYLGDGYFAHPKYCRSHIELYPYAFSKESVEYLVKELCRLGFKATRHADNSIYLWARSVQDFLKWIGPCPISCYNYRWGV